MITMADMKNGPREQREPSIETNQTTSQGTRCRTVETVHAALVIGPCDRCEDCGQPGDFTVDHWTVCPTRLDALRRDLAEALGGGGDRG